MIRIITSEYIEKMWIHLFIILMFVVTMLVGASMIGELGIKSSMYHSVMNYVDDRTIFLSTDYDEEMLKELNQYGTVIINKEYFATDKRQDSLEQKESIRVRACPDSVMNRVKVRLDSGKEMDDCKTDADVIMVYITHNNLGIKAGDNLTLCMDAGDGINDVKVKIHIAGVLSDGQQIYGFDHIGGDMNYTNLFQTYSYEQLGEILMITTDKEIEKLHSKVTCSYNSGIMLFDKSVSDEQVATVCQKLIAYEKEKNMGISFIESVLPDINDFEEDSNELYAIELNKYVPMLAVAVILSLVCLIGIVSVKTDMNLYSYTIFRLCGMKCRSMLLCSVAEIIVDLIGASVLFVSFVTIQNHLLIFDRINLYINQAVILAMIVYSAMVIGTVMLVTSVIVKKNTLVQLIKRII